MTNSSLTLVFTLCSNNYLAQAITLGNSLLKHNPSYLFKIGLVDKKNTSIDYAKISFEIIEVERIGINAFNDMVKRYSITELNTAVKPAYFQYFFTSELNYSNIIYLDPDILVYESFAELEMELSKSDIIIIPHITKPINDNKSQAENDFLNSGLYNLGFLALKRSEESAAFLDWWADRLTNKAHIDFAKGMFTDQLWINLVPLFFENVEILKHPGYNVAYWNLHERSLTKIDNNFIINSRWPLVFYHFSGYDPLKPEILSKYQDRYSFNDRKDVLQLFTDYRKRLLENYYMDFITHNCAFISIKERYEEEIYLVKERNTPILKRASKRVILKFIKQFGIELD
jgi:lipopolysaccharide biosynthesis glycosyltransferase